jgi:hypothetical protein
VRGWRLAICLAVVSVSSCALEERDDFLIGRACDRDLPDSCDASQVCLPHGFTGEDPSDFRCRDEASFARVMGKEPPLAYCDDDRGLVCPGTMVCLPDRVRERDGGIRREVCQPKDSPFAPPKS